MITGYLRRLDVECRPPSLSLLFELHRAQASQIPYTNVEIMLGNPGGLDPTESVARILRGNGGYCFQLNGALSWLLEGLGFRVTKHLGYVVGRDELPGTDVSLNHLALLVHDLPDGANPGGVWLVDTGLGDAIHEPLPLTVGAFRQGPFEYRLAPTVRPERGWRLEHDPAGSFAAADVLTQPVDLSAFAEAHRDLSTAADSPYLRTFTAQRRTATGVDVLRGCQLTRLDADGRHELALDTWPAWREALADLFAITDPALDRLWPGIRTRHERWVTRGVSA